MGSVESSLQMRGRSQGRGQITSIPPESGNHRGKTCLSSNYADRARARGPEEKGRPVDATGSVIIADRAPHLGLPAAPREVLQ